MTINIDALDYDELLSLNDRIIERMKHLDKMDAYQSMMRFNMGNKVCFDSPKHGIQVGTLIKFNQKTVTVLTEKGQRWKVAPQMLSRVVEEASSPTNVIDLNKKTLTPS